MPYSPTSPNVPSAPGSPASTPQPGSRVPSQPGTPEPHVSTPIALPPVQPGTPLPPSLQGSPVRSTPVSMSPPGTPLPAGGGPSPDAASCRERRDFGRYGPFRIQHYDGGANGFGSWRAVCPFHKTSCATPTCIKDCCVPSSAAKFRGMLMSIVTIAFRVLGSIVPFIRVSHFESIVLVVQLVPRTW